MKKKRFKKECQFLWNSRSLKGRTGIGIENKDLTQKLIKEENPTFCPICNRGRNHALPSSILVTTRIEGLAKCALCGRIFQKGKEVIVEVKPKPKPGENLKKMIRDQYQCPECKEICLGLSGWASHCWKRHGMRIKEFEKKYGKPEKSYYGMGFKYFNPSAREENV